MRKFLLFAYIIFLAGGMPSCSSKKDAALEDALSFAGKNRKELEKVLDYYRNPEDSLKLRAAKFLIANMPHHWGYYGIKMSQYASLFSKIDSFAYTKENLSNEDKKAIGDSIISMYGWPRESDMNKIYDSQILSAIFIINNIEIAFKARQAAPWGNRVSFEDFCEYILPYRIKSERVEYWRPEFFKRYKKMAQSSNTPNDARSVFHYMNWNINTATSFDISFDQYFPFDQSIGDIIKGRIGSCEVTAYLATAAMRSVGLPVGYDYIMHWGSTNSRHYMPHLVGNLDSVQLITNENVYENTWHLVDFSSEFNENRHRFTKEDLPNGLYVQNVRTIPKVYRYSYSQSPVLVDINKTVNKEFISPEFLQTNLKDVTNEYVTISNLILPVNARWAKNQVAYLTVFDIGGWQPVAIAKIQEGKAIFKNIGKNVMYLPTVYSNGNHLPIDAPFYIDSLNKIHKIVESNQKGTIKILRKYPLYTYTAYHSEILKGGRFEGANDSMFATPTVLYDINNYPFYVNEVKIKGTKKFRYLRYVASKDAAFEPDNIAEVQFIGSNSQPLTGNNMGVEGISGHEISKAFDNDLNTYYQNAKDRNGWIGIDLGANNQQRVKSIRFCPRNDTNGIIPGNEYELFYWDGIEWTSLGRKTATDYLLRFENVDSDALFWLRCLNGGQEERIFTYKNGMQVWW